MARFIPPHPKKGSPEAYAWAERMRALRKRIRRAGRKTEKQFFRKGKLKPFGGMEERSSRNPGASWHEQEERSARKARRESVEIPEKTFYAGVESAHRISASAARRMGLNPKRPHSFKGRLWFVVSGTKSGWGIWNEVTEQLYVIPEYGAFKGEIKHTYGPFVTAKEAEKYLIAIGEGRIVPGERLNPGCPPGTFRAYLKKVRSSPSHKRMRKNPIAIYGLGNPGGRINAKIEGVIYNRVIEVRAEKTGSWKPGFYRHPFAKRSKVCMLALDNGDILMHSRSGKKLWEPGT